jgi:hypothetical protein
MVKSYGNYSIALKQQKHYSSFCGRKHSCIVYTGIHILVKQPNNSPSGNELIRGPQDHLF